MKGFFFFLFSFLFLSRTSRFSRHVVLGPQKIVTQFKREKERDNERERECVASKVTEAHHHRPIGAVVTDTFSATRNNPKESQTPLFNPK